ncbi:hypothetical protein PTKIN_Ptkin09bG0295500 [Pterospermum kingtungense]
MKVFPVRKKGFLDRGNLVLAAYHGAESSLQPRRMNNKSTKRGSRSCSDGWPFISLLFPQDLFLASWEWADVASPDLRSQGSFLEPCAMGCHSCQRLAPKVVTVVEQELRHKGSFLGRFVEAIHYYSALFDSLWASYGEESEERHVVEQQLLSKEIRNVLAGPCRSSEEVKFQSWREKLQQSGFKGISLAGNAATQAILLLGMYPSDGYTLVQDDGALKLGWKDPCLLTASAWRPQGLPR